MGRPFLGERDFQQSKDNFLFGSVDIDSLISHLSDLPTEQLQAMADTLQRSIEKLEQEAAITEDEDIFEKKAGLVGQLQIRLGVIRGILMVKADEASRQR